MPRNDPRRRGLLRRVMLVFTVVLAVLMPQATGTASAADNPYQRGPDPTQASIAASRGTFATAEVSVGGGNGFGAAKIYYPTDTSQGTFGAIAIVPGYTATWAAEGAWMGPWLAPFSPSQGTSGMRVPAMLLSGQRDGTVTPSSVRNLYNGVPATTEKGYLELTGAGHGFPTSANSVMMRKVIPWMKIFVDRDTRFTQFLCPLVDRTGITSYESSCPLVPPGGGTSDALAAAGDGSPSDSNIRYVGRWDTRVSTAYVPGWAGAYAVVGFTGTTVKLRQRNSVDLYASIDGGPWTAYRGVRGLVNLTPTRLAPGTHTVRVSYRQATGSYRGDLVFQGVTLDAGARTVAASVPSRIVEFIGDSITAGEKASKMAVTSYGWVTGEKLGAAHVQVARASVCLYPASGCIGLRDRYLKTTVDASSPDWDFSRYQASDVLINLGTNDRGHGVSSSQFQSAYVTLMQRIRAKYPNANIYAMQTFHKLYVNETKAAVAARNAAGDSKVKFINTEGWINLSTDTADGTHPNDAGHLKIANRLVPILTSTPAAEAGMISPVTGRAVAPS